MTYLIDTDWVATYLKGRVDAITLLGSLAPQGLAISLITYGEIYEGVYFSGRDPVAEERGFQQFLRGVSVVPLNRAIMRRFARIRGELRRTGQLISDPDILIAATAFHHNLVLVTRNAGHFQRVPGLQIHQ